MKKSIISRGVLVAVFGITTLGVAAAQSAPPAPQADKQKPAAEAGQKSDAKADTITGCLEKGANATTFRLTNVEGTGPKTVELTADASQKLAPHVGHKMAITGPDIDPATATKGTTGKPADPAAPPAPAPAVAQHHMRVDSFKMISDTCK
jgi:hypothetical protein